MLLDIEYVLCELPVEVFVYFPIFLIGLLVVFT